GTMFSAAAIALMLLGPFLPAPAPPIARARPQVVVNETKVQPAPAPKAEPAPKDESKSQQTVTPVGKDQGSRPVEANHPAPIPAYVPKEVPFPCRKSFQLVPGTAAEWIDASAKAIGQGEVAVCVASATIEKLELARSAKTITSPMENLVIHLQVMLVGTTNR